MTTSLLKEQLRRPPRTSTLADAHETEMLLGYSTMVATRPETDRLSIAIGAWLSPIEILIVTGMTNTRTETANATLKNIKRTGRRFWNPDDHKARVLATDQSQMPPASIPDRPSCSASRPGIRTTPAIASWIAQPNNRSPHHTPCRLLHAELQLTSGLARQPGPQRDRTRPSPCAANPPQVRSERAPEPHHMSKTSCG